MKNSIMKAMTVTVLLSASVLVSAQPARSAYTVRGNYVGYNGRPVSEADARSFIIMAHGYAKDFRNVYYQGNVLPFVDPSTFRLREPEGGPDGAPDMVPPVGHGEMPADAHTPVMRYVVSRGVVYYNGREVEGAVASSFKNLGDGYAKDNFDVYYMGVEVDRAFASSFRVLGDGYARDNLYVFYKGREIEDAHASTFEFDGRGYAHDKYASYYRGKEIIK